MGEKNPAQKAKRPGQNRDALFYMSEYTNLEILSRVSFIFFKDFCYCFVSNEFAKQESRRTSPAPRCTCLCHRAPRAILHGVPCCDGLIPPKWPSKKNKKVLQTSRSQKITAPERPPEKFAAFTSRPPMPSGIGSS
jgi:hypothetical protein